MAKTLHEWLEETADDAPACPWRKRAWRVMRPVVERFVAKRDGGQPFTAGGLLTAIDAAREEARVPDTGKRWIQECIKLLGVLRNHGEIWPGPSQVDVDICNVARDLVELERFAEAKELMAQARGALNRPCDACGAKLGAPCLEITRGARTELVVPHVSRVELRPALDEPQGGG